MKSFTSNNYVQREEELCFRTKRITKLLLPTTKVERLIFNLNKNAFIYGCDEVDIRTGRVGSTPVTVRIGIDFNGAKRNMSIINHENKLTSFDREIHDAIASFYSVNHESYCTPKMLLRILTGRSDIKISNSIEKAIWQSIEKMRNTELKIDATNETVTFRQENFIYCGSLLPSEQTAAIRINNTLVSDCIHIRSTPLFEYAVKRDQISSVDIEMLGVPLRHTIEDFSIRGYLLRELLWMKHKRSKRSPVVLYKTLFEYLGINTSKADDNLRHYIMRCRKKVERCLDFWEKKGFINGYQEEDRSVRIIIKL